MAQNEVTGVQGRPFLQSGYKRTGSRLAKQPRFSLANMETEIYYGIIAGRFAQALLVLPLLVAVPLVALQAIRENSTKGNRRRFSLRRFWLWEVSFRKIGGIYFLKIGRFGCSFWVSKRKK
jgi:hypothetical protein